VPVDLNHKFGRHEAGSVAEQVLRPERFHGDDCNGSEAKRLFTTEAQRRQKAGRTGTT
jgi:hypothetical protein